MPDDRLHDTAQLYGRPTCGWHSDLPTFTVSAPRAITLRLEEFVCDAGPEQVRAWSRSIPWLQRECREVIGRENAARGWDAILEYELPREARRPDLIVLESGVVVVLELKGRKAPSQADLDQVFAYARDLRAYHADCAARPVYPVLVASGAAPTPWEVEGVKVVGPAGMHRVLLECARPEAPLLQADVFLRPDAYAPLPTLVRAARALFHDEPLPFIKRARAQTDPALRCITTIAREAAATGGRRLVLLTGVPGAGKTLVGLQLVHAHFLDDLSVPRADGGRPAAAAVFLSGNGPLVAVLQDALRSAGGGGKTFVRGVKDYVRHFRRRPKLVPPEHLLVFDEAQRAWDAAKVTAKHEDVDGRGLSEPELFVQFAERIPEWCVLVGLIGTGQEIHSGEEGGLALWRRAVEGSAEPHRWVVHAPPSLRETFEGSQIAQRIDPVLSLDATIRFHTAPHLHRFVEAVIDRGDAAEASRIATELRRDGHRLLITRRLEEACEYARDRYDDAPDARFGLLASSKDRDLVAAGVDNDFNTGKRLAVGPWYNAPGDDPRSCRRLDAVATEFWCQGLELDLAIVAWGSDYARCDGSWSTKRSRGTRGVENPFRLRQNAYRVLLTRGRDGTVLFVPPTEWLDETADFLQACGFRRFV